MSLYTNSGQWIELITRYELSSRRMPKKPLKNYGSQRVDLHSARDVTVVTAPDYPQT